MRYSSIAWRCATALRCTGAVSCGSIRRTRAADLIPRFLRRLSSRSCCCARVPLRCLLISARWEGQPESRPLWRAMCKASMVLLVTSALVRALIIGMNFPWGLIVKVTFSRGGFRLILQVCAVSLRSAWLLHAKSGRFPVTGRRVSLRGALELPWLHVGECLSRSSRRQDFK